MDRYAKQINELILIIENLKTEIQTLEKDANKEYQKVEITRKHVKFAKQKSLELKEKYDCVLNQPNYFRKTKKDYIKLCLICCLIFFPIVKILQFSYPFYVLIIIFSTIFNYFLETRKYRDFAKENNRQTIIEELKKTLLEQKIQELNIVKGKRAELIDSLLEDLLEQKLDEDFTISEDNKPYIIKRSKNSVPTEI